MEYGAEWRRTKNRYGRSGLDHARCEACGSAAGLHTHHRSYRRANVERLTDLVRLCGRCHGHVHAIARDRKSKAQTNVSLWPITTRVISSTRKRTKSPYNAISKGGYRDGLQDD